MHLLTHLLINSTPPPYRPRAFVLAQHLNIPKARATPFSSLLQLYTHDKSALNSLLSSYSSNPESIQTLIPQLITFLIYNAWLNDESVEVFILERCEGDLHFCHKVWWFLEGWCEDVEVIRSLKEKVRSCDEQSVLV